MTPWSNHPIFTQPDVYFEDELRPCFRFSAVLPYERCYHGLHTETFETLFDLFKPILKEHCDKLLMAPRPGAPFRRSLKIKPENWTPFTQLAQAHNNVENGILVSFQFADKADRDTNLGRGPTKFHYKCFDHGYLDICIPLADWQAGKIDIAEVVATLLKLPFLSFAAGFGLALGRTAEEGRFPEVAEIAKIFPALDVMPIGYRTRRDESETEAGICAINWITGIGQPFAGQLGGAGRMRSARVYRRI